MTKNPSAQLNLCEPIKIKSNIMNKRRTRVTFKSTKIISKPAKVSFTTSRGKAVEFKAKKDIPKTVRVSFLTKKKK